LYTDGSGSTAGFGEKELLEVLISKFIFLLKQHLVRPFVIELTGNYHYHKIRKIIKN
jgi:hypothetical protein